MKKNIYLEKILKIAGRRDEELAEDPAIPLTFREEIDDEDKGEMGEEGDLPIESMSEENEGEDVGIEDFWHNMSKPVRIRVSKLPDDIRDILSDLQPEYFTKAEKIIVRNMPKTLMSFEYEDAFDTIRIELEEMLKVTPIPEQPVSEENEEEDRMALFSPKFKKIAARRMARNKK